MWNLQQQFADWNYWKPLRSFCYSKKEIEQWRILEAPDLLAPKRKNQSKAREPVFHFTTFRLKKNRYMAYEKFESFFGVPLNVWSLYLSRYLAWAKFWKRLTRRKSGPINQLFLLFWLLSFSLVLPKSLNGYVRWHWVTPASRCQLEKNAQIFITERGTSSCTVRSKVFL